MPSKENGIEPTTPRETQMTSIQVLKSNPTHSKAVESSENCKRAGKISILKLIGGKLRAQKVQSGGDYRGNPATGQNKSQDQESASCSIVEPTEQACEVPKFIATEEGVCPGLQAPKLEAPESH